MNLLFSFLTLDNNDVQIIKESKFSDDPDLRRKGNLAWRLAGQRLLSRSEPMTPEEVDTAFDGAKEDSSRSSSRTNTPPLSLAPIQESHSVAQLHALDRLGGCPSQEEGDLIAPRMRTTSFVEAGADTLTPSVMTRSVSSPHLMSDPTNASLNLSGLTSDIATPASPSASSRNISFSTAGAAMTSHSDKCTDEGGNEIDCVAKGSPAPVPPGGGALFSKEFGQMGKGGLCLEYADCGTGDFRSPSFSVTDSYNDSNSSPLMFRSYQIYRGKLPMPDGLPGVRTVDDIEASTLVVTMMDSVSGLQVDLIYTAMHDYDCVTRRAVFKNVDSRPLIRRQPTQPTGGPRSFAGSGSVVADLARMTRVALAALS